MGRDFDGSYAEYVLAPEHIVFPVQTQLEWKIFGALPEMVQTTHGSLYQGLEIKKGQTLLIRGGTSSIGLCALEMAMNAGLNVILTTRSEAKTEFLKKLGASDVIVDQREIAKEMQKRYPEGVDHVLELIGAKHTARLSQDRQAWRNRLHDWHSRRQVGARTLCTYGCDSHRRKTYGLCW